MRRVHLAINAAQIGLFLSDLIFLVIISFLFNRYIGSSQSIVYYSFLIITIGTFSYIIGRYTRREGEVFGLRYLVITIIAVVLAQLVTYPFLSGVDRQRFLFLVYYGTSTLAGFIILSYVFQKNAISLLKTNIYILAVGNRLDSRCEELNKAIPNTLANISIHRYENEDCFDNESIDKLNIVTPAIVAYDPCFEKKEKFCSLVLGQRIRGTKVFNFVEFYSSFSGRIPIEITDYRWLMNNSSDIYTSTQATRFIRVADLILGVLFAIVFILPMLLIAIFVKLSSKGPILFKQERLGRYMHPFMMYKFRSMRNDAEKDGPQWATKMDTRTTTIGRIIRATHLDELPQIVNLLNGDISLVGPRPIRKHFADLLSKNEPYYSLRFLVKPGLTGWAQIRGPYGENQEEQKVKLEMELYYIYKSSLARYFWIIFETSKKFGLLKLH